MTEQARDDSIPAEVVDEAIDEALGGVLRGDFFVRAEGVFRSSGGHEEDYAFDSWRLVFLGYDESGVIDPGEQLFEFGSADVVIAHDGYDADSIRRALDDHSQWYADIGAQLHRPDGIPWESLMAEADADGDRGDVLFVMHVQLQEAWRGHGLAEHLLEAIVSNPIARTSALTVVRPLVWTEEGEHDVEVTGKLTAGVEAAGFTRHYDSELFLRSNTDEPLPVTSAAPDPAAGWERSGLILTGLFVPFIMDGGGLPGIEAALVAVSIPVPATAVTQGLPEPEGWAISYDPDDDALLAVAEDGASVVSRIGADGAPALQGNTAGTRKPVKDWLLTTHAGLHASMPAARAAITAAADDLLAGRTPTVVPGDVQFQAPNLGAFGNQPSPFPADARLVTLSADPLRAQLVRGPHGGLVLGTIEVPNMEVDVRVAPDEARSDEETAAALRYLADQGASLVVRAFIENRLTAAVFTHLMGEGA